MIKKVFADSGFFIAVVNKEDGVHRLALSVLESFFKSGTEFVTTDYVLDEVFTWMRCKIKLPVSEVVRFANSLQVGQMSIVNINKNIFGKAFEMMVRYDDHFFSFTDCVSFAVMKELKIKDAVTTDKHFAEAGFNNLLTK
ncbi:MAG: PIN domain-containing protein [Candidatus Gracilibacteria bacterium]|jgi:hypothetical protein